VRHDRLVLNDVYPLFSASKRIVVSAGSTRDSRGNAIQLSRFAGGALRPPGRLLPAARSRSLKSDTRR